MNFKINYQNIINKIISFSRLLINYLSKKNRFLILLLYDLIIVFVFTLSLLGNTSNNDFLNSKFLFCSIIYGCFIYVITGQYKSLTRYFGSQFLYSLLFRNFSLVIILFFYSYLIGPRIIYKDLFTSFFLGVTVFESFIRLVIRDLLLYLNRSSLSRKKKVGIYGAGAAGAQLAASLRLNKNYKIISFFDDNSKLKGRELYGIPIRNAKYIKDFSNVLDQILIAIPSLNRSQFRKKVEFIQKYDIPLMQIPTIEAITKGEAKIDSLIPIKIEDLLSRDIVKPRLDLMEPGIKDKVVCVTGAGGSIGSELCKQILMFNPKKLILVDQSEFNLYKIKSELNLIKNKKIELKSVLTNLMNLNQIIDLFERDKVNIVFHSAAYKHVPLVEENPLVGVLNNVISTKIICQSSFETNIDTVLLVSTDKAVRPTNIMGVSKRIAELIIQSFAEKNNLRKKLTDSKNTKFSMVRFGNVLNSSGSVVPLFKEQISKGGPITITHKEVIRYFMTIEEAANLLIQSSLLAKGGDLFLLDMGSPVKIYDLALKMIKLSGLKIKNKANPDGDIEIIFSGLRAGEKLFEELLIDNKSTNTSHPLIYRAEESFLMSDELLPLINQLEDNINNNRIKDTYKILKQLVPEWDMSRDYMEI